MLRQIVECVPNFSEGRDAAVVARIVQAIAQVPGAAVLGQTSDCDHNRSVLTFAGAPAAVAEAAFRGIECAVARVNAADAAMAQGYLVSSFVPGPP